MRIAFEIPDDLAAQLTLADQDPARTALEAIVLEAYRAHRLTGLSIGPVAWNPQPLACDPLRVASQIVSTRLQPVAWL